MRKHVIIASAFAVAFGLLLSLTLVLFLTSGSVIQSNNNSGGGSVSQSNNNSTPSGDDVALGAVTAVGTLASGIGAVIGGIAAFKSLNVAMGHARSQPPSDHAQ